MNGWEYSGYMNAGKYDTANIGWTFANTVNDQVGRGVAFDINLYSDGGVGTMMVMSKSRLDGSVAPEQTGLPYTGDKNATKYVRLLSERADKAEIYSIRIISDDITEAVEEPVVDYSKELKLGNTSGTLSADAKVLSYEKVDGMITAKVKLGTNDYVQFKRGITDLIDNPNSNLQINLGDHEFGGTGGVVPYRRADFRVGFADSVDAAWSESTPYWPMRGQYYMNGWEYSGYMNTGKYDTANIGWTFAGNVNDQAGRGVAFDINLYSDGGAGPMMLYSKSRTGNESVAPQYTGLVYNGTKATPKYVRVLSKRTDAAEIYNIRIISKDIKADVDYSNVLKLGNTAGKVSDAAEVLSYVEEDGFITAKVKLGTNDYVQFKKGVTDLIDNPNSNLQINLADHEFGGTGGVVPYRRADFRVGFADSVDAAWSESTPYWPMRGQYYMNGWEYSGYMNTGKYDTANIGWTFAGNVNDQAGRGVAFDINLYSDGGAGPMMLYSKSRTGNESVAPQYTGLVYNGTKATPKYVRVLSKRTDAAEIYNIRIYSEDYKVAPEEPEIPTVTVAEGDEFVGDTRGFGVLGAQVRTSDNSLRFIARISKDFIADIEENFGEVVEYGMALVSANYFGENGGGYNNGAPADLTIGDGTTTAVNKNTVANVKAVNIYNDFDDYYRYTAVITGLKSEKQMSTQFCARAYIIYEDAEGEQHVVYADEADNDEGAGNYKTGYGAYWKSFNQAYADLTAN